MFFFEFAGVEWLSPSSSLISSRGIFRGEWNLKVPSPPKRRAVYLWKVRL